MLQDIKFQTDAAQRLTALLHKEQGVLLQGGTGTGKTYITAQTIKQLLPTLHGKHGPIPVLWIGPAATVQQTQRVLREYDILQHVMVMSYASLTSKSTGGTMFYDEQTVVRGGTEQIDYKWKDVMLPALAIFDECQALKNDTSTRTAIAHALPTDTRRIYISATPYQRVCEARVVMVGCAITSPYNSRPLCNHTVPSVMRSLATYGDPTRYSPRAMESVKEVMEPYTVALKNVRFKHKARTECTLVQFSTDAERAEYNRAYTEYLEKLYLLRGQTGHSVFAERLVAMMKFRQKAEEIRSPIIAQRAYDSVTHTINPRQVIIGSNFKGMLRGVWLALTSVHNVPAERIGFITGGQSAEQRQQHVDAFQRGDMDYMLLTITAGGVGISLHHEEHHQNARPRHIILPPTWSAIDLIQCIGRSHRLTSASDTQQDIIWYEDTVEETVAGVVENKVRCINRAVAAKEQWSSLFAPADLDATDSPVEQTDDDDDTQFTDLDEGLFA